MKSKKGISHARFAVVPLPDKSYDTKDSERRDSMKTNNVLTPRQVRRFVRQNIGRRVDIELISGRDIEGVIVSARETTFRLRIRRRNRNIIIVISYRRVRDIELDRD
jgi:hypothetical protein